MCQDREPPLLSQKAEGSILGCILFTLTTDGIDGDIDYGDLGLNEASRESMSDDGAVFPIDLSLARIVTDTESAFGLHNISVESELEDTRCVEFHRNGHQEHESPETQSTMSTPTARGQFVEFQPPGNLITDCLSGEYSSTTGLTFVYMDQARRHHIMDLTAEGNMTIIRDTPSTAEYSSSESERVGVAPYVYIDDTNGIERLKHKCGIYEFTTKKNRPVMYTQRKANCSSKRCGGERRG